MNNVNPHTHTCAANPDSSCPACEWIEQNSQASAGQDNQSAKQASLKRNKELLLNVLDSILDSGQAKLVQKYVSKDTPAKPKPRYAVLVKTDRTDA
jgi:hypothetical protein